MKIYELAENKNQSCAAAALANLAYNMCANESRYDDVLAWAYDNNLVDYNVEKVTKKENLVEIKDYIFNECLNRLEVNVNGLTQRTKYIIEYHNDFVCYAYFGDMAYHLFNGDALRDYLLNVFRGKEDAPSFVGDDWSEYCRTMLDCFVGTMKSVWEEDYNSLCPTNFIENYVTGLYNTIKKDKSTYNTNDVLASLLGFDDTTILDECYSSEVIHTAYGIIENGFVEEYSSDMDFCDDVIASLEYDDCIGVYEGDADAIKRVREMINEKLGRELFPTNEKWHPITLADFFEKIGNLKLDENFAFCLKNKNKIEDARIYGAFHQHIGNSEYFGIMGYGVDSDLVKTSYTASLLDESDIEAVANYHGDSFESKNNLVWVME